MEMGRQDEGYVRSEAFMVTECNEVILGSQPCKNGVEIQHFGDRLCFHQLWQWRQRQSLKRCITTPFSCRWLPEKTGWRLKDDNHIDGVRLHLQITATNGPVVHPPGDMSMDNHGGMTSTGENSWVVHQSSLAILPVESSSSKSGGTWQRK
jgi:hypothetical protein